MCKPISIALTWYIVYSILCTMITDTRKRIIEFITKNGQARVYDLVLNLEVGNVAIHRQLNKLISAGVLRKIGNPPLVFYSLNIVDVSQIRNTINQHQDSLRKVYKVKNISVFGSVARGENKETSDIDLLVELREPIGIFRFIELEEFLSRILGKKVDLVTKKALKPAIRQQILQEAIYV